MNTETLNKIKSNISEKFASIFTKDELAANNFIPINKQAGFFFVAIKEGANKSDISKFISQKDSDTLKFISLNADSFNELFDYYSAEYYKHDDAVDDSIASIPSDNEFLQNDTEQNIVVESNDIKTHPVLDVADAPKKRIGEILIDSGELTEAQLVEALTQSKKTGTPIGSMLVSLGFITVDQLKDALSAQQGFQHVTAQQLNISEATIKILPEDFIKENKVVPLYSDGKVLDIGMVNPNNKKALNEIVYLTGMRPRVLLMSYMEFKSCMTKYFGRARKETKEIIKKIEQEALEFEVEESLWEQVERELEDTSGSVANFATKIITDAIDMKASDIHIEPRLDCYTVRYRIDGILRRVLDLPQKVESSLIARFKVLSRNTGELKTVRLQ